jgi:hypothetical protein
MKLEDFAIMVENFLKKEGFLIFPTSDVLEDFPEIRWVGDDWKGFIMVAKHEGIKTMFVKKDLFTRGHIESSLYFPERIDKNIVEYNNRIKSFEKYIGRTAIFSMFWIKDDIVYSFVKYAPWAEEFLSISLELKEDGDEEISWM